MLHPCSVCSAQAFSDRQAICASAMWPLKCPRCGALNAPSYWAVGIAVIGVVLLMAGGTYALLRANWVVGIVSLIVFLGTLWAQHRYIALAPITQRSVRLHRRFGLPVLVLALALLFWLMPE